MGGKWHTINYTYCNSTPEVTDIDMQIEVTGGNRGSAF